MKVCDLVLEAITVPEMVVNFMVNCTGMFSWTVLVTDIPKMWCFVLSEKAILSNLPVFAQKGGDKKYVGSRIHENAPVIKQYK